MGVVVDSDNPWPRDCQILGVDSSFQIFVASSGSSLDGIEVASFLDACGRGQGASFHPSLLQVLVLRD